MTFSPVGPVGPGGPVLGGRQWYTTVEKESKMGNMLRFILLNGKYHGRTHLLYRWSSPSRHVKETECDKVQVCLSCRYSTGIEISPGFPGDPAEVV